MKQIIRIQFVSGLQKSFSTSDIQTNPDNSGNFIDFFITDLNIKNSFFRCSERVKQI